MIERIKGLLASVNIQEYIIKKTTKQSCELFFVKNSLDLSRAKKVTTYELTVFASDDLATLKGQSTVFVEPMATDDDIKQKIAESFKSAKTAMNPTFELADKEVGCCVANDVDLVKAAHIMANAIFTPKHPKAFVNSAEIFAQSSTSRVVTSKGTDVTFSNQMFDGEFVAQAKQPTDVEIHISFAYDKPDEAALTDLVASSLKTANDRAVAEYGLKSGVYDVVLDGKFMGALMHLYSARAYAPYVYMHYSNYEVGKDIQANCVGEKLNITMKATSAYSSDGVKMVDRKLIDNGVVSTIYGKTQYCRYLGLQPTGEYDSVVVDNGTVSFSELLSGTCLYVVAFSDFQCDPFTGVFGGEIRLAYLYDNGTVKILTGGSVNGNLLKSQDDLVFATERYYSHSYTGPKAVRIKNVTVAGSDN